MKSKSSYWHDEWNNQVGGYIQRILAIDYAIRWKTKERDLHLNIKRSKHEQKIEMRRAK